MGRDKWLSIDGEVIGEGQGHCWLDDDRTLAQRYGGVDVSGHPLPVAHIDSYDTRTKTWTVIDLRGANSIVGGDSLWATHANDAKYGYAGYADVFGNRNLAWTPLAIVRGGIGVSLDHTNTRFGVVRGLNHMTEVARFTPRFAWQSGYVPGWGLGLWPAGDQTKGLLLSTDAFNFHDDCVVRLDGTIVVVASLGAGERPHELRRYEWHPEWPSVRFYPGPREPFLELPLERVDLSQPPPPVDMPPTPPVLPVPGTPSQGPLPPTRAALLKDVTIMVETELVRGLLRERKLLSVEPKAHNNLDSDVVRWLSLPHGVGGWERLRIHAPDPATPDRLAIDVVKAGKRFAVGDNGVVYLNPLTAWGHFEQFMGGKWPDGREYVVRATPVPAGDEAFALVKP